MLAAMQVTLEIPRDNDGGNFDLIGKHLFFSHGVGYFEIGPHHPPNETLVKCLGSNKFFRSIKSNSLFL